MSPQDTKRAIARWEILVLCLILLLGVGFRVVYLFELSENPELKHPPVDEGFSLYWARGLAIDDWRLPPEALGRNPQISTTAYIRPPGYAFVLAAIYRLTGGHGLAMRALQMFVGLLNLLLGWWLGRRLRGPRVGMLLAILMALAWPLLYFEGGLNASVFLITLSLLLCLVLRRLVTNPGSKYAAAAAGIIGLMALLRANVLLIAPFLLLWGWWVLKRHRAMERLPRMAASAILAGALILAPTTIRNARVEGGFVPVSANGGLTLYHGNNADSTGISTSLAGSLGLLTSPWVVPDIVHRVGIEEGRALSFHECSKILGRRALHWMFANPKREAILVARRFALFWGPDPIAHNHVPAADRMASPLLRFMPISFPTAVGGGLVGAILLLISWRRKEEPSEWNEPGSMECFVAIAILLFSWCLSFLPFFATSLYRAPLIPFLLLGLAVVLAEIVEKLAKHKAEGWRWMAALAVAIVAAHLSIVKVPPGLAQRDYDRGIAWAWEGKPEKAAKCFQQALESNPAYAAAHNGLGKILLDRGDVRGARRQFALALRYRPEDPIARSNFGLVAARQERWTEAAEAYETALKNAPAHPDWWLNLGICFERLDKGGLAIEAYENALKFGSKSGRAANNLAWLLATSQDSQYRNGPRALRLARRILKEQETPSNLDTLAASLAETGEFDKAVAAEDRALALLGDSMPELKSEIESRRRVFFERRPFRERR